MPDPKTISNSSCLIGLEAVGQLDLLANLYGSVFVPPAVLLEWGGTPPSWLQTQSVANQSVVQSLRNDLGPGEAEAVALALEVDTQRIILDDKKARRVAAQFGLPITGTVGIILQAKTAGLVPLVRPILEALAQAGFRLSAALTAAALKLAGE